MNRLLFGVAAVVAGLSGCASPARYVNQQGDTGIVAIPADTDIWPTYYRTRALEKIREHVGPNYEIIDQGEVVTGKTTMNSQQVNNGHVSGVMTTQDTKEWQIAYRKKHAPAGMTGLPGMGGVQQTQYRPAAGLGSGVQPAGGFGQPGAPGNSLVPSVAPVGAAGMPGGSGPYVQGGATIGSIR
jgi:hypothetical protein